MSFEEHKKLVQRPAVTDAQRDIMNIWLTPGVRKDVRCEDKAILWPSSVFSIAGCNGFGRRAMGAIQSGADTLHSGLRDIIINVSTPSSEHSAKKGFDSHVGQEYKLRRGACPSWRTNKGVEIRVYGKVCLKALSQRSLFYMPGQNPTLCPFVRLNQIFFVLTRNPFLSLLSYDKTKSPQYIE